MSLFFLTISTLISTLLCDEYNDYANEKYEGYQEPLTIGSLIKLQHQNSKFYLHSHDISWGSGSRQQSVTAFPDSGDSNGLFQIFGSSINSDNFTHGSAIKCNDAIRLKHINTKKWLHSHGGHRSPLSNKQEVTCYGNNEQTDEGDDWRLICNYDDKYVRRGMPISVQHKQTKAYLFTTKKSEFHDGNCRGCPILGQLEVSASYKKVKGARWITQHGFYFKPYDMDENHDEYVLKSEKVKTDL